MHIKRHKFLIIAIIVIAAITGIVLFENSNIQGKEFILAGLWILTLITFLVWMYFYYKKKNELFSIAYEMRDIAEGEGDLTKRLEGDWKGDVGELMKWMNVFIEKVHNVVSKVKEAGDKVASANQHLNVVTDTISEKMIAQADKSAQVAAASHEMAEAVADVAKNTSNISTAANETLKLAQEGGGVVNASVEEVLRIKTAMSELAGFIKSLGEHSNQIGEIVEVINDIAAQTNLLALNAAIEAARAGDVGRGFAVVADEVKKLSEKTSKSTGEIGEMIKTIQIQTTNAGIAMDESLQRVESGVGLSNKAGESLKQIVGSVNTLQEMLQQIAASTMEMSATAEQVNQDIEEIASISSNTTGHAQEMYATSFELAQSEQLLASEIAFFKTGKQNNRQNGKTLNSGAGALSREDSNIS